MAPLVGFLQHGKLGKKVRRSFKNRKVSNKRRGSRKQESLVEVEGVTE